MHVPQTEVTARAADGTELLRTVLAPGEYVIGRDTCCDLRIAVEGVAAQHARLTINFDHALIESLSPGSATLVNGTPIEGCERLWPNQKIQIGAAHLEVHRIKTLPPPDVSLAPSTAAVQQLLPEEIRAQRKYDIGGVVARGGMGAILDAKEAAIERTVAMKVMLDGSSPDDITRFVAEAKVTGQLEHPNIVPVHELNVDENDQVFYTMKFVRGTTLRKVLEALADGDAETERKYPLSALLTVFQKVCDAIAFAHSKGVIHRDLKPENIMLGDFGEVLVMDWGLAKVLGGQRAVAALPSGTDSAVPSKPQPSEGGEPVTVLLESRSTENSGPSQGTLAGTIMGTPQYMAPEQARGEVETMDVRADIYALGAILYHLLALRPSVSGNDAWEIVNKVARGEVDALGSVGSPSRPGALRQRTLHIPDSLAAVVRKAMALERAQRYASVAELQAEITAYQNGFATGAERAGLGKQLVLLIKRHRGIFGTAAAAWLVITALAGWFVVNVTRERNRATANEQEARQNARIAQANEQRAAANEVRAVASEQEAVAEKENVRRALAKSALALAEAAYRDADGPAMQSALDQVPADLRDANWSYLLEQSDTSIARISNGSAFIRGVAANPKLPGVFAVADHQKVVVLEARSGARLLQFKIDLGATSSGTAFVLAFSPDGERIAVGKMGGGIAVHSARDGTKLAAWDSTPVSKLSFSPDGGRLLQQGATTHLNLWDVAGGKLLWRYEPDTTTIRGEIMPDGQQVLTTKSLGTLVLLNMEDGTETRALNETVRGGKNAAFAIRPDGHALLWGDRNGKVYCTDLQDDRLLFSTRAHTARVEHLAFTADGERFISEANLPDGRQSILLSDAKTGDPLQALIGGVSKAEAMALHPLSGEVLICGPNNRLWDTTGTAAKWALRTPVGGAAMSSAIFLGSDDLFIGPEKNFLSALMDLRNASTLWKPANNAYHMPTVSADGRFIAFAKASPPKGCRVLVAKQDAGMVSPIGEFVVAGGATRIRLSPTGDRLAVITNFRERLFLLAADTGAPLGVMDGMKALQGVNDLHWIGGGTQLVGIATVNKPRGVAKSEERIIVWDAATGQQVRSVVHPTALDCLVVAPDGKSFAAAGADKLVHVFDTATLAERQAFRAHDGPITALAWHPARPIVATGSADLTIKVWNIESGRRLETLRGPTAAPSVLNFSPSGQRLACASEDRMVRIWEPKPLQNAVLDAPAADGWEDLLAKLKADEVKANGNGWTLSGGVLVSSGKPRSVTPLPGNFARSSYTVRTTLRRLKESRTQFAMILPVGDQQVAFVVDGDAEKGFASGLSMVDNKSVLETPSAARGQQISDSEPHDLEITVRLSARTAHVTATLDDRQFYEWSGTAAALQISGNWPTIPQPVLHVGSHAGDWVVSAVKVKRL